MTRRIRPITLLFLLTSMVVGQGPVELEMVSEKDANSHGAVRARGDPGQSDICRQVRLSQRELWRAGIVAPVQQTHGETLQQAIRSVLAQTPASGSTPDTPATGAKSEPRKVNPSAATQPSQPEPAATTQPTTRPGGPAGAEPPSLTTQPSVRRISPITLGRLRRLSPKGVSRPIALGDSLFLGGYFEEAGELYKMAMQREPSDEDRGWLLLQMANCKRISDPDTALGLYRRLVAEQPDSPWSGIAQIQGELIMWRQKSRPDELLDQLSKAPATADREQGKQGGTTQE